MSAQPQGVSVPTQAQERRFPLVVHARRELADGVIGLTLTSPEDHDLPVWEAGAHIDLLLADDLVRQYSLCGDPTDRHAYQVAILREPKSRGGSSYLHDSVKPGVVIDVRGPRNHFELVDADDYLFIAGGIGVTPILAMIRTVEAAGRRWRLAYGGRSRSSMAFGDELPGNGTQVQILPQDEVGLLPLADLLSTVNDSTAVYCCGPEPLLNAVETECTRQSVAQLHVERFAPKPLTGDHPNTSFEVSLARSGQTLSIGPDESILDVIERSGVPIDSSCRDGTCATCEVGVLEGVPDHRDSVLSPAEQEACTTMMVCVSRCRGARLVLDL